MLSQLLEDAYSDKRARKNAEIAFDAIIENIKSKNKQSYRPIKDGEAFVLDSVALAISDEIPAFKLVLREPTSGNLGKIKAGYSDKHRAVHVMMDLNTDWVSQLLTMKSAIIHEFIHHFDNIRSGGNMKSSSSSKTQKEYFNNDAEVNAYYQEAVHEFEKLYSKIYASHGINTFIKFTDKLKTFEAFKNMMIAIADSDFIKNISPENEKKLTKRLYGYYTDIYLKDVAEKLLEREH